MKIVGKSWVRNVTLFALVFSIGACGLPRVGPNKREIMRGSVEQQGNAFIVEVNDRVTQISNVSSPSGFSAALRGAGVVGSDTIHAGDTLGISIWENVEDGVLTTAGAPSTLTEVQVDGAGYIFIPYAGRIRAAGNSPEAIRGIITRKLAEQTPDPQVMVSRVAGDGSTVTLTGALGQGVFPITRPTRTLTAMLASSGGLTIDPKVAKVRLTRGGRSEEVWLQDLFDNPSNDIPLRGGDRILVEEDQRTYVALGATGGQSRSLFGTARLSALEALAQIGGLSPATADPTGVFVFRDERADVANRILGRSDLTGEQRLIYVLNLTQPNGLFIAREFMIRDGDTIYVTEAPYVQWTKVISAATGTLATAGSISSLTDSLAGSN